MHKKLLKRMDMEELLEKVRAFRRLDLRGISDEDLGAEILNVLSVTDEHGNQRAMLRLHGREWPKGTMFFRARRVADLSIPPIAGKSIRDAEAPDPSWVKKPGRLHKTGEPILYTTIGAPHITFSECRIPIGGFAVIFVYRARKTIKSPMIGAVEQDMTFTSAERVKINILNDFLHDEFAREVEVGLEHLYRPSEIIAKWYFDGPPPTQDCWTFGSTKVRNVINAAFRPNKAHECLDLVGALLAENTGTPSIKVHMIGKPIKKRIEYFPIGSQQQQETFPEIRR